MDMVTIIKKGTPRKEIRERIKTVTSGMPEKTLMDFAGKLKTRKSPLEYQISIRNEWE